MNDLALRHATGVVLVTAILTLTLALASPAAAQSPCGETYTVVYGDTLQQIAGRCNTSVEALLGANPEIVNRNLIFVSQELTIPKDAAPSERMTYLIKPGDWLSRIADRFNTTTDAILALNPDIEDPNVIHPGQEIIVPGERAESSRVTIAPTSGAAGTDVSVEARGLPANTEVNIGVGRADSEFDVVDTAVTDGRGRLATQVVIPDFAEQGERWIVVVETADHEMKAVSNIFAVTGPTTVSLYFIALEDAGQSGEEIGCDDSLVSVEYHIGETTTPLEAAMKALLSAGEYYGQSGLYNALHRSDLQVDSIALEDNTATVNLTGDLQLGGTCDNPRVEAQLEQTALQFETVDEVSFFIDGELLEDALSLR